MLLHSRVYWLIVLLLLIEDIERIEIVGQNLIEDFEDYEPENIHDQVIFLRLSGEI